MVSFIIKNFFGILVLKKLFSLFEHTKQNYRMAAVMCPVLPHFYKNFCEKALFVSVSVKDYRPHILTSQYVVASHNSFCPLKTGRYHIILISSSTEDLLRKLEDLSYLCQTVDYLYTLYKHQFFGNILEDSGLVFTQLDRAVQHTYESKFVEKLPSVSKERLTRKKFKRNLCELNKAM